MNKHLLSNTFTFDILFTISFKNIYSGKHLYKSVKFHFMFNLNHYQKYIQAAIRNADGEGWGVVLNYNDI